VLVEEQYTITLLLLGFERTSHTVLDEEQYTSVSGFTYELTAMIKVKLPSFPPTNSRGSRRLFLSMY
jgi:hypothetical protein